MSSSSSVQKPVAPDLEGYLDKLKHKVSFFGSWNKRYFRMNIAGERLEYFASEKAVEKGEVKGHITLANLKAVKKFDDLTFQIDGGSDGAFMLKAGSPSELACWVRALENYLKNRLDYARYMDNYKAKKIEETSYNDDDNKFPSRK